MERRYFTMFDWIFGITGAAAEAVEGAAADAAAVGEVSTGAAIIQMALPIVLMIAVFYFLLIRPQKKKDKKVKEMLDALKPGDRVTTIGGIYGTIKSIKDDTVTLLVGGQQTEMVVARWGIRQVEEVTVENDGEILA